MILEKINKPNDIKKIPLDEFPLLAQEIRDLIIETVSSNGGHLASNLGVVELTLALHNVLDFPEDKLIWDVGHQSYTHKILSGRRQEFTDLRKEGGISGFPKRSESPCDAFDAGHSSDSISVGLGYARARDLKGENYHVVSVIGDGALTGGMAYEAMNNAAELDKNFIIVLNDNEMSIARNVGGMSSYLGSLRTTQAYTEMKMNITKHLKKVPGVGERIVDTMRKTKSSIKQFFIPGMLFEDMGLIYLGPVDGHNMRQMMRVFNEAKRVQGPVVVHVITEKGRGYAPACIHPERYHGTGPFDIKTGNILGQKKLTYTEVFGRTMKKLAAEETRLTAITAAMPHGTGLIGFADAYPDRFFDVGIAEEHSVSFAVGLALGGMIPVVAVYSSFLQRAVDQILQEVCMQKLHVVFAIDRAGLVGSDGETHQGNFDISYLSMMPDMTVMAPGNARELELMLEFAIKDHDGPCAIRYPRGNACRKGEDTTPPIAFGKSQILRKGRDVALIGVGSMVESCIEAEEALACAGKNISLINARFVKPLDTDLLDQVCRTHSHVITVEENVMSGGFGEHVNAYCSEKYPNVQVHIMAVSDCFVGHGPVDSLREKLGLSPKDIEAMVIQVDARGDLAPDFGQLC